MKYRHIRIVTAKEDGFVLSNSNEIVEMPDGSKQVIQKSLKGQSLYEGEYSDFKSIDEFLTALNKQAGDIISITALPENIDSDYRYDEVSYDVFYKSEKPVRLNSNKVSNTDKVTKELQDSLKKKD